MLTLCDVVGMQQGRISTRPAMLDAPLLTVLNCCSVAFRCVYGERMLTTSLMSWITGIGLLLDCTLHGTTRVCDNFTSPAQMLASLRKYEVRATC